MLFLTFVFFFTKMVERQGETARNVLRSQASRVQVPVRFKNRSGRRVKVIWRNYKGEDVPYVTLDRFSPADSETASQWTFRVNTFVTNPWIAVDEISNERMLLNFEDVFMPMAPRVRRVDYQRRKFVVEQTEVLITAPGKKRYIFSQYF